MPLHKRTIPAMLLLLTALSVPARAGQPQADPDPLEPHMERLDALLERLPGEIADASERLSAMTDRLLALLPQDAEIDAALTQFRLFLDGLYLKFSGETAPIPGYHEVRDKVFEGIEPAEQHEDDAIEA